MNEIWAVACISIVCLAPTKSAFNKMIFDLATWISVPISISLGSDSCANQPNILKIHRKKKNHNNDLFGLEIVLKIAASYWQQRQQRQRPLPRDAYYFLFISSNAPKKAITKEKRKKNYTEKTEWFLLRWRLNCYPFVSFFYGYKLKLLNPTACAYLEAWTRPEIIHLNP